MFFPDSFKLTTPSDRELEVRRDFDAPRQMVFDAFTKPELTLEFRPWMDALRWMCTRSGLDCLGRRSAAAIS